MKNLQAFNTLKLLIIEKKPELSKALNNALTSYFQIISATNHADALEELKAFTPDVIITELHQDEQNSLKFIQELKAFNENLPVIVLCAFSNKELLLEAIELGISKYFITPCKTEELVDHLIALALKIQKQKSIELIDGFRFDHKTLNLYLNSKLIHLTKRESAFIVLLLNHPHYIVSIEQIKSHLWENKASNERVRTFIRRLRAKTSKHLIQNISAQGYMICKKAL